MNQRPLVSVVIIFLNEGRFLAQAIDSVLAQDYPEWELLLIDDGSTDESTQIARDYAQQQPECIRYLQHSGRQNRGMSASRNLGLSQAQGEYVVFLDGDDALLPRALSEQVAVLQANRQAAMVYGPIQYWFSWTGEPADVDRDYVEQLGVAAERIVQPPALLPLFLRDRAAVPSGFMVRRDVAHEVGGFEEQFRGEYEDQVFSAKIALKAPVYAAGRCWYRYRQHSESAVAVGLRTGTTDAARRRFLAWLGEYLVEREIASPAVWRALRLEEWRFAHPRVFHMMRRGQRLLDRLAGRIVV